MSESPEPDLSWVESIGEDVEEALNPTIRRILLALKALHAEMGARDGGD
ncbi:MAG: hypothetical protein V3U30_03660 [Thermoplasmata archaeon]